jgi:hypothetical protein
MRQQKKGDTFCIFFMLFNKGKLMIDYENFRPLFNFLKMKKNPNRDWSDKVNGKLLNMFTTKFW